MEKVGDKIEAQAYFFVDQDTVQSVMQNGMQVLTFPFLRFPLRYTAFQPIPAFTAAVLLKPYDRETWVPIITILMLLASAVLIQTVVSCGGCFDANFWLIGIILGQPSKPRASGNIIGSIFGVWLMSTVVLSEAYKGMILSYFTKPTGVLMPKSAQELLSNKLYSPFNFESVLDDSGRHIPLLELTFERDEMINDTNQFYASDYLLLKQAKFHSTKLDSATAAAEFLYINKYKSNEEPGVFGIGDEVTTKSAYLHYEFTESFVSAMRLLLTKLVGSSSVEIPGLSSTCGFCMRNGFLFQWYSTAMRRLTAAGFAEAILNHWRIWNPCIYLSDVFQNLKKYLQRQQPTDGYGG